MDAKCLHMHFRNVLHTNESELMLPISVYSNSGSAGVSRYDSVGRFFNYRVDQS